MNSSNLDAVCFTDSVSDPHPFHVDPDAGVEIFADPRA